MLNIDASRRGGPIAGHKKFLKEFLRSPIDKMSGVQLLSKWNSNFGGLAVGGALVIASKSEDHVFELGIKKRRM